MNGIRIKGQPTFPVLFEPVFDRLQGLSWITFDQAFRFPAAWVDVSDFDEEAGRFTSGPCAEFQRAVRAIGDERGTSRGYASSSDLFPRYAEAVTEDWNIIIGFTNRVADPLAWFREYYATEPRRRASLLHDASVCFVNVDAAYWEFYARDAELIELLRPHLATLDVSVDACVLDESYGL